MAEKWNAGKYRKSADKHYKMCKYIIRVHSTFHQDKDVFISTLYYLGGYVIECTLKGMILENEHERDKFYDKDELRTLNLLTHDLFALFRLAQDKCSLDLPQWQTLAENTQRWSENVRYDYPLAPARHQSVICEFWSDVEKIYNIYRDNY